MAKVTLRATGGLNKDIDPNNLPEGDYVDASNIVFDAGKTGGAGALRLMESFASMGITLAGTPRATFQNVDNIIYVLCNNSGGTATIHKIIPSGDSFNASAILTYPHNAVDVNMVPDLKVIGDMIVWNYAEGGTVLAYNLTLAINLTFTSIEDLKLQKKTPNNVVKIRKVIGTSPLALLENTDFQFAARYQYASKEYSVLGNYSQMFKAEKGVQRYEIEYDFSNKPFYATDIELFVRIGNNGSWRKADIQKIADYPPTEVPIRWTGQMNESLDLVTVGKPFDAIPENVKNIEIAKNRLFLANIQDDYSITAANTKLDIGDTTEPAFGGTGYKTYFGGGASDIGVTSTESVYDGFNVIKPFANNSTYAFGIAYYDAALKTRGVEASTVRKFTTAKFDYPAIPNIAVSAATGYVKPSWAKYMQLVYTKNISKSYSYEGFASNIFFEISVLEENPATKVSSRVTKIMQSVTKDQLPDVKFFVIDLMGMFLGGRVYTLQEGDRISINVGTTAVKNIIDLRIVQQNGNLIYCDYSGGALTNPEIPIPKDLFFEIYSPRNSQEDEALLFYEYGNLIDISAGFTSVVFKGTGTLNTDKLIGDMVFSRVEIPVYETSPFENTSEKILPETYEENKKIVAVCSMSGVSIVDPAVSTTPNTRKAYPKWTSFGTGNDAGYASIVGSGDHLKVARFYEPAQQEASENKVTIGFSLNMEAIGLNFSTTNTDPFYTMDGSLDANLVLRLYRIPYNNKINKYSTLPAVKFGNDISTDATITYADYSASILSKTINFEGSFNLNTLAEINANDKFYIEIESTYSVRGDAEGGCEISITGNGSTPIVMTLNGDPNLVKVTTKYNPSVTLGTTNEKYIIRSISNAVSNQQWNTSAGKPSVIAANLSYPRRTNAIRYSGNFIAGTSVNNINSFFALDSNEVPIENGEIVSLQRASRLQGNGAMLLALCPQETAYVFLGEQELTQGNNASIRALTTNMIGTIRNMGAGLGVQNKLSVMNQKGTIWWWDNFNRKVVRYTESGVQSPSDVGLRSFFLGKSGIARFAYDPFYNMIFIGFLGESVSMGWSDRLNRWIAEYSFVPTFAESYGDKMILMSGSTFYKSLQSGYNTFFGSANNGTISMILNSRLPVNPLNVSIWHNMNVTDYTKAADSNGEKNYVKDNLLQINITNENGQATQILEGNFLLEDNRLYAHVMRNTNTPNVSIPLIEGDYIVGYLNKFVVTLKDKTQSMRINSIDVEVSPVTGHS
jgi:hypothetical protein